MVGKQRKKSNSERQQISHRYLSLKPLPNSSVVVYNLIKKVQQRDDGHDKRSPLHTSLVSDNK